MMMGFNIFFPFSDRSPVDMISVWGEHTERIQVKSRWMPRVGRGQDVTVADITPENADALIVYINTPPSFYIIPTTELRGVSTITLYPTGRSRKRPRKFWDEWKDRWDVLKNAPRCT